MAQAGSQMQITGKSVSGPTLLAISRAVLPLVEATASASIPRSANLSLTTSITAEVLPSPHPGKYHMPFVHASSPVKKAYPNTRSNSTQPIAITNPP